MMLYLIAQRTLSAAFFKFVSDGIMYVQTKSGGATPTKRARDGPAEGTPPKAAKPSERDRAGGRSVSDLPTVPEASQPPEDGTPMSDAAACSPARPDVPSDVMDAAAALVSASSGGVHVSCAALLCTLLLVHAVRQGDTTFSALPCLVRTVGTSP